MESSILEQERVIKDAIRRAKGSPEKSGSLRRNTLKRLIDLTHSPHPTLKILAAQNIRFLFSDFPELEEEAINAVYDLCEDQSPKVRMEGYTAITHVSRAEKRLVKRNADVLLQLLQSDEPDEVIVVKKALTEHLDMDPKITLGVLCDQIAPPTESTDEEEQSIRDRLRALVLSFLTGEAKYAILERHALPESDAEEVLLNSLLTAIPKLGISDIEIIVKDLLLPLKAYKSGSVHGRTLLQILLAKTTSYLRVGSGDVTSLHSAKLFLDLVAFIVIDKHAAPAIQLLQFYCSSFSSKIILQKFSKNDQHLIACNIAETLLATDENDQPKDDEAPLEVLKRHIIDCCPFLLESLAISPTSPQRTMNACAVLLRACLQRKEQAHWQLPPNLISTLGKIQTVVTSDKSQEIQGLIRSLVPSSSHSLVSENESTTQDTIATNHPVKKRTNDGRPTSLPERPPTAGPSFKRTNIATPPEPQDRGSIIANPVSQDTMSRLTPIKHQMAPGPSPRPPKRQKGAGNEHVNAEPSLLSRLGTSLSRSPISRASPPHSSNTIQHISAGSQLPPNGEYSIKGAAKVNARSSSQTAPRRSTTFTLLDRLQDGPSHMGNDEPLGGTAKRNRGRL